MTLRSYQTQLQVNTLYSMRLIGSAYGTEQLAPSLEVVDGTVDIFGSQLQPVAPPVNMALTKTGFVGIDMFAVIPNFLYLSQKTGITTQIIISGIEVKEIAI